MFVEIVYEISEANLSKFHAARANRNIINRFPAMDIVDDSFEYFIEVECFMKKYYQSSVTSSKIALR